MGRGASRGGKLRGSPAKAHGRHSAREGTHLWRHLATPSVWTTTYTNGPKHAKSDPAEQTKKARHKRFQQSVQWASSCIFFR